MTLIHSQTAASASAFSLSAAIPSDAFLVIQGEPVIGGLHGPTRHFFCAYCMSWVFTRADGFDAIGDLRGLVFGHDWEESRWAQQ
jgi:hypothetical protein